MSQDERAIREFIAAWMEATRAGDTARVLELIDDEVVFLGAGRPPMRGRASFADASRASEGATKIDGEVSVQDVRVFGDYAYCWNQLTVTIQPAGDAQTMRLAGPAMAILRKGADGRWRLWRDANMLTPVT
jgi:uncharacterized protein (TIGR02246 family)